MKVRRQERGPSVREHVKFSYLKLFFFRVGHFCVGIMMIQYVVFFFSFRIFVSEAIFYLKIYCSLT